MIHSIAFYGEEVFFVTEPAQVKEVAERKQNRLLRRCLAAPWYVRNQDLWKDSDLEDIINSTWHSRFKMEDTLLESENSEIQEIALRLTG